MNLKATKITMICYYVNFTMTTFTSFLADGMRRYISRISPMYWAFLLLVLLMVAVWNKRRIAGHRTTRKRAILSILAAGYFLLVLIVTFGTRLPDRHMQYQLIPFLVYRQAWQGDRSKLFEIVCNIALFAPFGVIWPLWRPGKKSTFFGTLGYAAAFSFCIEIGQLVSHIGYFEFDDILNNVLGAVLGYGLFCLCRRIYGICLKMYSGKRTGK